MDFSKVKRYDIWLELIGTYVLIMGVLASLYNGFSPLYVVAAAFIFGTFSLLTAPRSLPPQLNPVFTLALLAVRKIKPAEMVMALIGQLAGALFAIYSYQQLNLSVPFFALSSQLDYQAFYSEFIGTFAASFLIAKSYLDKTDTGVRAWLLGGGLLIGGVIAGQASTGIINPLIGLAFGSLNAALLLGPLLGALVGFSLYNALKR